MSLTRRAVGSLTLSAALVLALAPAASAATGRAWPSTIALPDGSQPEGIAYGGGTTFFAGSRTDGAVYRGSVATGTLAAFAAGFAGGEARGMNVESSTGLLWVAGDQRNDDGTTTSYVSAYDHRTGALEQRYTIPGQRFLNDVEVTQDGVWVTDSLSAELVHVHDGVADLLPLSGDWVQPAAGGLGANGIRKVPGGDLIITDSSTGDLFRVDHRTGAADRLEIRGADLTSGDGLEIRGSTLWVVYGFSTDAVAVVTLDPGARSGQVVGRIDDTDLDRPTTAVLVKGDLYAVNGRFSTPPTPTTTYDVVRLRLH